MSSRSRSSRRLRSIGSSRISIPGPIDLELGNIWTKELASEIQAELAIKSRVMAHGKLSTEPKSSTFDTVEARDLQVYLCA